MIKTDKVTTHRNRTGMPGKTVFPHRSSSLELKIYKKANTDIDEREIRVAIHNRDMVYTHQLSLLGGDSSGLIFLGFRLSLLGRNTAGAASIDKLHVTEYLSEKTQT